MSAEHFPEPEGFEIPAFLRRSTQGATPMPEQKTDTQPAVAKKRSRSQREVYMSVKIALPFDMADHGSVTSTSEIIEKIKQILPSSATFESEARIGKIEAAS